MTDKEEKLQERVIGWLKNNLDYTYLGNLENEDNEPVKADLLTKNLKERGYETGVIKKAITDLQKACSAASVNLYDANKEVYSLLRYGCQGIKQKDGTRTTVQYIDWKNVKTNDFYVAEEVTALCANGKHRKRPDVVLYVNGIALAIFELKRSCVDCFEGISDLLDKQREENIATFFSASQLLFAGNEAQGLYYGTIGTPMKRYLQWREYDKAKDKTSLEIKGLLDGNSNDLFAGIVSMCKKERLLSLIYEYIIFDAGIKKVARHNQFFAVECCKENVKAHEGGIVWNTQGSGKSLIMVWLAKWIKENIADARVVIVTDREELDDQIESVFVNVDENVARAKSCEDLRNKLNGHKNSIICSLIHKYGHNAGSDSDIEKYRRELLENLPDNYEAKGNIVAFIDECHRTNSGKLHEAMKQLMPKATLIGFTGTPLLKKDKKTSIEIFGPYIHTYKFNDAVKDGVVLDLRYEARDIDQSLTSKENIDRWFEAKTEGLTEKKKQQLKSKWATLTKLYSSKPRLGQIVNDIMLDMETKPRLREGGRGTAMLVAGSINEACQYWDIFQSKNFTKCAVVTSYEPSDKLYTTNLDAPDEEEYKKKIYERMLNGKSASDYEKHAKEAFKKEPEKCKLLIVVDKLLTGFDAPSATYLYIDKSMRDHDLFQAICRVNRPDGEEKDFGHIVDYKDLFRNLQAAVHDYTSESFDGFDKDDVEGLLKDRAKEAHAKMKDSRKASNEMLEEVSDPKEDTDYIDYFCKDSECNEQELAQRRETMYSLVSSYTRSFADCCDELVSTFGYESEDVEAIRKEIADLNKMKKMIKLASGDSFDLRPYEQDMRFILDSYISADASRTISSFDDKPLVELLINNATTMPMEIFDNIPADSKEAKAEVIENNIKHEIIKKFADMGTIYSKLSEMLEDVILQRKREALTYEEYLRQVELIARYISDDDVLDLYPDEIKDSNAKREMYDYFCQSSELTLPDNGEVDLTCAVDAGIKQVKEDGWHNNVQKQRNIQRKIYYEICEFATEDDEDLKEKETENVYDIAQRQKEYL